MQANWSLFLNVLLLIGVVIAIGRLMKARRRNLAPISYQPTSGSTETKYFDDIISVRKVNRDEQHDQPLAESQVVKTVATKPVAKTAAITEKKKSPTFAEKGKSVMMFLLAKDNRQLAGYELLQTVLAAGLRFGEGNLFHRHQHPNGQGPILCSLAAATATGVFDLHNIGAFSARGLCLFMQSSGNSIIDAERFSIMYETAKHLSEGLDTLILDEQKQLISSESIQHYKNLLHIA